MNTLISGEMANTMVATRLALRVVQPGAKERIIAIPPGKCTIGSSQRCQIQLDGSEVRPLHCLVVQNEQKTIVTRWASGVSLNGQDFASAPLCIGDCLQIGNVQLYLVDENEVVMPEASSQLPPTESSQPMAEREPAGPTSSSRMSSQLFEDRMVTNLWTANYQARHRCRGLVASLRDLRAEVGSTEQQMDCLKGELRGALKERDRISRELAQIRDDATEQELQIANEMGRLIEELNAANEQRSQTEATSADREVDQEQTIHSLECSLEQMREKESAVEQRFAEQAARSEQLQIELEQLQHEREQLAVACQENEQSQQDWEQTLSDRDRQVKSLKLDLEKFQEERSRIVDEMEAEQRRLCEVLHTLEEGAFAQIDDSKRLEESLALIRQERDDLVASQPEREQRCAELQHSLEERDREIAELGEQLAATGQVRGELEAEIVSRRDAYQALEIEVEGLRSHCETLEANDSSRSERESELQQSLADYQQRLESSSRDFEAEITNRGEAYLELESEAEGLRSRCETLLGENSARGERENELQQSVEDQLQRLEALNGELEEVCGQRESLEERLAERTEAVEQHKALEGELRERFEQAAMEHAIEVERRQKLDQQVAERQQRVELLDVDLQSVRAELERTAEQVSQLEAARIATEEQLAKARQTIEKNASQEVIDEGDATLRDELQSSLETAKQEIEAIRQQLTEGESRSQELDQEYQRTQQELAEARDSLLTAEQTLQTQAAEAERSASELDSSLGENNLEGDPSVSETPTDASEDAIARLRELSVWTEQEGASEGEKQQEEPEPVAEDFKPPSFIDQYSHLLDEEGKSAVESVTPTTPVPVASAASNSDEVSEDAALEEYMAKMLQRMRGGEVAENSPSSPASSDGEADSVEAVESEAEEDSQVGSAEAVAVEAEEPIGLAELRQTSRKPKLPTDLAAMRELANSSARQAIAKHHKKRYLENAFGQIVICAVSLTIAVFLLMSAEGYQSTSFYAGCVAAFVGGVWGIRLLVALYEASRVGSRAASTPVEIPVEDRPLPIDGSE